MVLQTDHNRNTTSIGCAKCHHLCSDVKKINWDESLPVPSFILPWSSWIIFIVSLLCFGNSIYGDFVFDDSEAVINNSDLKPDTPVLNIFQNDFWGTKLTHNASHKSYRPLTVLTFRLNYLIAGLEPCSFHFVNIILHAIVCILILKVISVVLLKILEDESPKAAFLSALLFAVHPIHTESVSAVVGRADLLCGLFFLLSFLLYVHAVNGPSEDVKLSLRRLCCCIILAGVAMLCKEHGITVIGACCIYDVIFCKFDLLDLCSIVLKQKTLNLNAIELSTKVNITQFIMRQCIMIVGGSLLFALRWYIMGASTPVFQQVDNPASFADSLFVRIINYNYIYSLNVWLLIHPYWLCFDWSMGCIPLIYTSRDPRLLIVLLFWICFSCLLCSISAYSDKKVRRLLYLSLMFIIVPFLPASNLFFRVGFVVAERILYLPSMGFCLLVVIGMKHLSTAIGQNNLWVLQCCLFLLVAVFGVRCIQMMFSSFADITPIHSILFWKILTPGFCSHGNSTFIEEWLILSKLVGEVLTGNNEEYLFRSGLKVCPLNAKIHYNIAKNAADHGDRETAIQGYREAIRLNPLYDQAMNNLANILKDQGKLLEAEKLLMSAIEIRSDFAAAWMNLGIVQSSLKKVNEAEKSYLMALHFRRRYPDCFYNLGNLGRKKLFRKSSGATPDFLNCENRQLTGNDVNYQYMIITYLEQKLYEDAYKAWRNATAIMPTHLVAWNNMVIMLDSLGDLVKAEAVAREALLHLPYEASLHFNLANTLGKAGKYSESEKHFLKAIQLNEQNPTYHTNLGVLYHRWKKYSLAEAAYKYALKLKPDMKSAQDNLRLLYKTLNRV